MEVTANKHKTKAQDKPEKGEGISMDSPVRAPTLSPQLQPDAEVPKLSDKPIEPQTEDALKAGSKHSVLKPKSKGERIHNIITYQGMDWLLNATFGVAFATWTERTAKGSKFWKTYIKEGLFDKPLGLVFKEAGPREEAKTWAGRFLAIMFGGTATIPPITILEKPENKKKIVQYFDKKAYGEEAVKNDPELTRIYHDIENEPKQDFSTGMVTRFVALAPILAAVLHKPTNAKLDQYLYTPISKGTKWAANKLHIRPGKDSWMKAGGAEGEPFKAVIVDGERAKNNWDFTHHTIGFDFGLSAIYAAMHEPLYKMMAALKGGSKNEKEVEGGSAPDAQAPSQADEPVRRNVESASLVIKKPHVEGRPGTQVSKIEAISRQQVQAENATAI